MLNLRTEYELKYPTGWADSAPEQIESPEQIEQYQISGRLFVSPVLASLERTAEGQFVMSEELLNCYGVGDTIEEAAEDLISMLLEYHAELSEARKQLSRYLRRQLEMLDYFLGQRS